MTRAKLLSKINYALNHIQYGEEEEKEIKAAFKKLKKDLKRLKKLEEVLIILNIIYEWELEVKEVSNGTLGYFIYSPYGEGYYNITEDQYNNFKEVLEYIKTLIKTLE